MLLLLLATACVPLDPGTEQITAGDLARGLPAFTAAPPETPLGLAPMPGVRRLFQPAELARLAARLHLDAAPSAPICLERPVAPLDPARLLEAMQRTLPGARITVLEYSRHPAPAGEIEFPRAALARSGLWRGAVRYSTSRRFAIWARVRAEADTTRLVAAVPLPAGRAIGEGQVRVEAVTGFPAGATAPARVEDAVGRIPTHAIAVGGVVLPATLLTPPEVARGDTVRVDVQAGATRLSLIALAETGGRRGDRIVVRNPDTKRAFPARVTGPGTVSAGGTLP